MVYACDISWHSLIVLQGEKGGNATTLCFSDWMNVQLFNPDKFRLKKLAYFNQIPKRTEDDSISNQILRGERTARGGTSRSVGSQSNRPSLVRGWEDGTKCITSPPWCNSWAHTQHHHLEGANDKQTCSVSSLLCRFPITRVMTAPWLVGGGAPSRPQCWPCAATWAWCAPQVGGIRGNATWWAPFGPNVAPHRPLPGG